jgi:hypothetical protein
MRKINPLGEQMDKIKAFFNSIWQVIALVAVTAVGILLYMLKSKQKDIDALNAQIQLADTQKKADLIEVDIKQRLSNISVLDKETTELNNSLALLEQKRKDISASESNKTSDQIQDYWNKK